MEKNKILVVDDNRDNRFLLGEILSNFFPVKEIIYLTNGLEAWDEVKEYSGSIWIVITDWEMPRMNGVELIKKVKMAFPEIPIILTSANPAPTKNPADGFLSKPFRINDLATLIQNLTA